MSAIESVLVENRVFPPSEAIVKSARISGMAAYEAMCQEASQDFEGFWARLARENVVWNKPFTRTLDESNAPFYKWFEHDGVRGPNIPDDGDGQRVRRQIRGNGRAVPQNEARFESKAFANMREQFTQGGKTVGAGVVTKITA